MRSLLLLLLVIGVIGDVATTYIGFSRWGCIIERNPITRATCYACGYLVSVIVGGLLEFTVIYMFLKLYDFIERTPMRLFYKIVVALLPYIAVVNNTIFLLTH
jgi:magnesium-transporting ATPase (P-type)